MSDPARRRARWVLPGLGVLACLPLLAPWLDSSGGGARGWDATTWWRVSGALVALVAVVLVAGVLATRAVGRRAPAVGSSRPLLAAAAGAAVLAAVLSTGGVLQVLRRPADAPGATSFFTASSNAAGERVATTAPGAAVPGWAWLGLAAQVTLAVAVLVVMVASRRRTQDR